MFFFSPSFGVDGESRFLVDDSQRRLLESVICKLFLTFCN